MDGIRTDTDQPKPSFEGTNDSFKAAAPNETGTASVSRARPDVLITIPRVSVAGGVSNFYQVLREHLDGNKKYFEVGSLPGGTGILSGTRRLLSDYRNFDRTLSMGRFGLVHLNPSLVPKALLRDALFLLIARRHKVPVWVLFHGWDIGFQRKIATYCAFAFRSVFNKAAGISVLAEDFRIQLRSMGIRTPVIPLTTCVADRVFDTTDIGQPDGRRFNVLYLSRLDHGKGVQEAIKAFALARPSIPKARLYIAGDGPERNSAQKLVSDLRLDDVIFLGHIEGQEKHRVFSDADTFFFPTFYGEGMPTTVLEAMAYGLPVITRSVGGLKDFFEDGRMGYITESRDCGDFADYLRTLGQSETLRRRIGAYNREYSKRNFSASVVAGKLEQIYESHAE